MGVGESQPALSAAEAATRASPAAPHLSGIRHHHYDHHHQQAFRLSARPSPPPSPRSSTGDRRRPQNLFAGATALAPARVGPPRQRRRRGWAREARRRFPGPRAAPGNSARHGRRLESRRRRRDRARSKRVRRRRALVIVFCACGGRLRVLGRPRGARFVCVRVSVHLWRSRLVWRSGAWGPGSTGGRRPRTLNTHISRSPHSP